MVAKGGLGGNGMDEEFAVGRCRVFHLEWISNEVLLYSTGNYIQSLGQSVTEDSMRERMCVYVCVCVYQ